MGILDSFFSPATYGGQGGGLLEMLQNSLMQQNSYQPSAGFPPAPQAAPPASAPENPIGIGGYQMPRIGDTAQFTPDPATIPQNAQPAQGQLPQQPQQSAGGFGAGIQGLFNNLH